MCGGFAPSFPSTASVCGKMSSDDESVDSDLFTSTSEEEDDEEYFRTGNSDVHHFFETTEPFRTRFRRIPGKGVSVRLRFTNLEECGNIEQTLTDVFDELIATALPWVNPNDRVGIQISSDNLDKPILIPFRKRKDLNGTHIVHMMEKVMQSKSDFSLTDDSIRVMFTALSIPSGGVRRPTMANFEEFVKYHKRPHGILIEAQFDEPDNFCFLKACVIGMEYHMWQNDRENFNERWDYFRRSLKIQPKSGKKSLLYRKAMELLDGLKVGSGNDPWTLEDIRHFETARLWPRGYCLKIISKDNDNMLIHNGLKHYEDFRAGVQPANFVPAAHVSEIMPEFDVQCDRYPSPTGQPRLVPSPDFVFSEEESDEEQRPVPPPQPMSPLHIPQWFPPAPPVEAEDMVETVEMVGDLELNQPEELGLEIDDAPQIAQQVEVQEEVVMENGPELAEIPNVDGEEPEPGPELPEIPTVIHILHYDEHFVFMSSPHIWYGKRFYCRQCSVAVYNADCHECSRPCQACGNQFPCHLSEADPNSAFVWCVDCRRCFANANCFRNHLEKQIFSGNQRLSVCDAIKVCEECRKEYPGPNTGRKFRAHKCFEKFCRRCKQHYLEEDWLHYCHMTKIPAKIKKTKAQLEKEKREREEMQEALIQEERDRQEAAEQQQAGEQGQTEPPPPPPQVEDTQLQKFMRQVFGKSKNKRKPVGNMNRKLSRTLRLFKQTFNTVRFRYGNPESDVDSDEYDPDNDLSVFEAGDDEEPRKTIVKDDDEFDTRWVVYDVEASQDRSIGLNRQGEEMLAHDVVLVVSLRACPLCGDLPMEAACPGPCGEDRLKRFKVVALFGKK